MEPRVFAILVPVQGRPSRLVVDFAYPDSADPPGGDIPTPAGAGPGDADALARDVAPTPSEGEDAIAEAAEAWARWMDLVHGHLEGAEALLAEHRSLVEDEVDWSIY